MYFKIPQASGIMFISVLPPGTLQKTCSGVWDCVYYTLPRQRLSKASRPCPEELVRDWPRPPKGRDPTEPDRRAMVWQALEQAENPDVEEFSGRIHASNIQ